MAKDRRPDLIVGDTGSGKSRLAASAAESVFAKTGKKTRLYTADGAELYELLTELGIGEVCNLYTMKGAPFEVLEMAAQGYWPDAQGRMQPPAGLDAVGLFIFEGLTPFGEWELSRMADLAAKGGRFGPDAAVNFTDGERAIGGNGMAYYNIVQNDIRAMVKKTYKLPARVIWTSRESKDMDDDRRQLVFGPMVAGKAMTASAPAWFANVLGLEVQPVVGGDSRWMLHLKTWYDKTNPTVPHLCKIRDFSTKGAETHLPATLTGYDINMERVDTLIEQAEGKARAALEARLGINNKAAEATVGQEK